MTTPAQPISRDPAPAQTPTPLTDSERFLARDPEMWVVPYESSAEIERRLRAAHAEALELLRDAAHMLDEKDEVAAQVLGHISAHLSAHGEQAEGKERT